MTKWFRKNKNWVIPVVIVLVTAIVVGVLAASTNMISKISNSSIGGLRDVNTKNLIAIEDYEDLDHKNENGIKIEVAEDGTIILNGEAEAATSITLKTFATTDNIVADPDDDGYTLCGISDGSLETYYLQAKQGEGVLARSCKYGAVLTSAATAEITITIEIVKGAEFDNVKINPVVVPGSSAQSFYA